MAVDVDGFLASVAASMSRDIQTLSQEMLQAVLADIPELAADQAMLELLFASTSENIAAALQMFTVRLSRNRVEAPLAALTLARRLAQRGVPVTELLRSYRIGQAYFQVQMMRAVGDATTDSEFGRAAAIKLSEAIFGYADSVSEQVVAAYRLERDNWMHNRAALRSAEVKAVLSGTATDLAEAELRLDYVLRQQHLGAVLWIDPEAGATNQFIRLEAILTQIADYLSCESPPLFVAPDDATLWAWFPQPKVEHLDVGALASLIGGAAWLTIGELGTDVEGFRRTHDQARQAQAVCQAASAPARVTSSVDVGVVGLLGGDLDALADWVYAVLGELAVDVPNNERLRETLWEFLSTGSSFTAAAQRLGLHKNTVQYRVRKAEQLTRHLVRDDRLDIEVALRVCRLLGTTVLRPNRAEG